MQTKAKVMVVDDDEVVLKVIQRSLQMGGYDVEAISDGRQAMNLIERYEPDLVLLDVMMPHLDGFQILRNVKAVQDIPIIMITAKADVDAALLAFDLGAEDYLRKPFLVNELLARVEAVLRRSSAGLRNKKCAETEAGDEPPVLPRGTMCGGPVQEAQVQMGVRNYAEVMQGRVDLTNLPEPKKTPVDLRMLVATAIKQSRVSRSITITSEFPDEAATVKAEPVLIEVAISNLLLYAAQLIRDTGRIEVKVRAVNGVAEAELSCGGEKIPIEHLNNLTGPWIVEAKGAEMLLALAKLVIDKHNGDLEITTGEINRFCISLPLCRE